MSGAFLACDADGCGHKESVPALSADYIGKPCPKCGASLLTESDYADWVANVQPGIDVMVALGLVMPMGSVRPDDSVAIVSFQKHNGTLTIKTGGK